MSPGAVAEGAVGEVLFGMDVGGSSGPFWPEGNRQQDSAESEILVMQLSDS